MIKHVIKRGGQKEPYDRFKIMQWGEWSHQGLLGPIDWYQIVMRTEERICADTIDSQELQLQLIKTCLELETYSSYMMAGRLYGQYLSKRIYGDEKPTVQQLHRKLHKKRLMVKLSYSDKEYREIEEYIDHTRDWDLPHFSLDYVFNKYALRNRATGEVFETPQFLAMRMAMAIAENTPKERRMVDVKNLYDLYSRRQLCPPTPNNLYLGTTHRGFASCCVMVAGDNARSLAIANHIAYTMTYMSAGVGGLLDTRTLKDSVRDGMIQHNGKLPYLRSYQGASKANTQGPRAGAFTSYTLIHDPQTPTILHLKNPMSTEENRIRNIDYGYCMTDLFLEKAFSNERIFTFTSYSAPDLFAACFGKDPALVKELYDKYENDPTFHKEYVNAREVLVDFLTQSEEVGREYYFNVTEANIHTPLLDPIYSSNLCAEIAIAAKPYFEMTDLYSTTHVGHTKIRIMNCDTKVSSTIVVPNKMRFNTQRGPIRGYSLCIGDTYKHKNVNFIITEIVDRPQQPEVGLCSLCGIIYANIHDNATRKLAAYYALLTIDRCIDMAHYELPHIKVTAQARRNAGVSIVGLATWMAANNLKYDTQDGREAIHRLYETHAYNVIEASLLLGEQYGNAEWMDRTKWPQGWLPIDTYNRNVDEIVAPVYYQPWEELRSRIIANRGIRNSTLLTSVPSESSSKPMAMPNGVYAPQELVHPKTDADVFSRFAVPYGDIWQDRYQLCWDISNQDMIKVYGIISKWSDQSISADLFRVCLGDELVNSAELLEELYWMWYYGVKSRYYLRVLTSKTGTLVQPVVSAGCAGGACQL